MDNWVLTIISGTIGAIIGTYGGAFFLHYWQNRKTRRIRSIAIKALKIFLDYPKKSYTEAENQFNTLTYSEKRAVMVALHKLGVPMGIATNEVFDIKNIHFLDRAIDKDEIKGMIAQVKQGSCDNLFYTDVESYFTANFRILAKRNAARKYVNEVLLKSTVNLQQMQMTTQQNWVEKFSFGEYKIIQAFREQVNDNYFFDSNGYPNKEKIDSLLNDIDLGLWDEYLCWSFEAYQNVKAQNFMTQMITAKLTEANNSVSESLPSDKKEAEK